MTKTIRVALASLAALAAASSAEAAPYRFTISGDYAASFVIDTDTIPDFSDAYWGVGYNAVAGFTDTASGFAGVQFFSLDALGGLVIVDMDTSDWLLEATGPQLYTGSATAPGFATGTFALQGLSTPGDFSITIEALSAVPEPASWAMMIGGFALAGGAMRRRVSTARLAYS